MNIESEKEVIHETVRQFFDSWSGKAFDEFPQSCHQEARFFVKTSEVPPRPLSFIKALPGFVGIQLKTINQINIGSRPVASVLIEYEMTETHEGESQVIGHHESILNMIKIDGEWTITGFVDYGVEV